MTHNNDNEEKEFLQKLEYFMKDDTFAFLMEKYPTVEWLDMRKWWWEDETADCGFDYRIKDIKIVLQQYHFTSTDLKKILIKMREHKAHEIVNDNCIVKYACCFILTNKNIRSIFHYLSHCNYHIQHNTNFEDVIKTYKMPEFKPPSLVFGIQIETKNKEENKNTI